MSIRKLASRSSVALALACVVLPARGAEPITNWSAPACWDPGNFPAAEGPGRGMSTESGILYSPLPFVGVSPCRIADTRGNGFTGAFGPPLLAAGSIRSFPRTAGP